MSNNELGEHLGSFCVIFNSNLIKLTNSTHITTAMKSTEFIQNNSVGWKPLMLVACMVNIVR